MLISVSHYGRLRNLHLERKALERGCVCVMDGKWMKFYTELSRMRSQKLIFHPLPFSCLIFFCCLFSFFYLSLFLVKYGCSLAVSVCVCHSSVSNTGSEKPWSEHERTYNYTQCVYSLCFSLISILSIKCFPIFLSLPLFFYKCGVFQMSEFSIFVLFRQESHIH